MQLFIFIVILLVGCLLIPIGFSAEYKNKATSIKLIIGPFSRTIYADRGVQSTKRKKIKSPATNDDFESSEKNKPGSKKNPKRFIPFVRIIFDFLLEFKKKCRINDLRLIWILADDDPCDLSVNYGHVCAVFGNLIPYIESQFAVKNKDVKILCDYSAESSSVDAGINFTISLGNLLLAVICHGKRALCEYLKILKEAKDGATL